MEKVTSPIIKRIWHWSRPWLVTVALIAILRFTGALSYVSVAVGKVLIHTGIMNPSVSEPAIMRSFDYDFQLSRLDGEPLDVKSLRGKTLFINVWATWCGPCRIEMPSIQKLYNEMDGDTTQVAFLMISVDHSSDRDKVASFISRNNYTFPVYTPAAALPDLLQVRSIPSTFVVTPDGRVAMEEAGAANYNSEKFRNFLRSLAN